MNEVIFQEESLYFIIAARIEMIYDLSWRAPCVMKCEYSIDINNCDIYRVRRII